MLLIKIVCFVIISGLFRQPFANAKSAAVSTLKRLTIDTKNIKKPDIGFSVQKDMPKCTCPDNVDLNEKKPNGEIYYNKLDLTSSFVYCTNCVSIISAPPGYQVEVTKLFVNFYNDSKASLTIRNGRGNDGYVLENAGNAMTVTFSTSNFASSCRYVSYTVTAKLHKLPTSSPLNYSLSSNQPFHMIKSKNVTSSSRYWTITAETGKQVHLYLYGSVTAWFKGNIFVIDGTDVNGTIISQVTQFSASSNEPLTVSSSSSGSLTILLDFVQYSFYMGDVNFIFTQMENDPSQCGTSKLVYLSSDNDPAVKVSISNHDGGTASCPAVLVTNAQYSPSMQLNISILQGSMVLYGGLDYPPSSKNEIKRFSSMDDVSSPVRAAGSVFLVQPNPGSMMNLSFQTHPYNPFAVNYNYSRIGQMRFDTSYDNVGKTSSPGLSPREILIIVYAAILVPALLIRCLAYLHRMRSQQNDANLTVLSVYFIPSEQNEGDLPPPYAEAMNMGTPTAST